jgi:ABC-type multidrug transport system fused ATPase/permease subunit
MENFQEEDTIVKGYDSKLMKRLIRFAKPYMKYIVLVIIIMLTATLLDISRTLIVKNTIDDDINGYRTDYTLFTSKQDGSIKVDNVYVKKGKLENGTLGSIIYYNNDYYLVWGKINHDKPYDVKSNEVLQEGAKYKIVKLNPSELKVLRKDDANAIIKNTFLILAICLSIFVLNYVQVYLLNYTGQKIVFNIREQLFKHVEHLSLSFFDKNPVGRLVTRLTNDIESINEMYTDVLVNLFKDLFLITFIIIAMFMLDRKLAMITVCVIPIIIVLSLIFKKYDREAYRDVKVKIAKINSSLSENISGMKTVEIFHKEDKKFKEFDGINKDYYKATTKQITVYAIFRPIIDLIAALSLSALLWFGGKNVLSGSLTFGVLFAFVTYMTEFFQPIYDLSEKYDILQSAMASSERIFALLDTDETIENKPDGIKNHKFKGEIEFKNVWFAYTGEEWVLKDVSFKIKPGEKVAFVGATGAGKTSIISLISRFYEIQKGEILIDGINIKDYDLYELRKNIATVLQDVFLFTGDIKNNVRLGNSDISDEDVVRACKYVNADKFIEKLPDKYDTYVNEGGTTFSQGERQLIAFARAISFNPPILVLDEATSNIDTETESLIQDALKKITQNRTTIVVAHRLSTIKNCDNIIVMHKGRIRETGTHEELLKKQGYYYNLYQLQYKDME